ncbi:MAG: hypothetical protein ACEQR5_04555 [Moraxellaceae bacterium]
MKNREAIARKLAKLYGIEIIEKSNAHEFVKMQQVIFTFEQPAFWGAFGLNPVAFSERLTQPFAQTKTCFTAAAPIAGKEPVFETATATAGNYNYAMAA